MPGLYEDEGIVLKAIKLGEADRIVTLFTRENGQVRAVAKGVRKTKSRFGARLEPFTCIQLGLYRGRSLDTITAVDIISSFRQIRDDYHRLASACALAEVVEKITLERERSLPTYALLHGALQALADGAGTVVPAFLIKLLSLSGYHPQLSACAGCGRKGRLWAFSAGAGGVVCDACSGESGDAIYLPADRVALIARLLSGEFGERAEGDAILDVMQALRRYAEHHLERPLRSLQLLTAR